MDDVTLLGVIVLLIERGTQLILSLMRQRKQNGSSGERDPEFWLNRLLTQESHRRYVDDVVKPMGEAMRRLDEGMKELLRRRR